MNFPSCHHENPDTAKFCNECGTRFGPPQTPQPEGERRQLTVMFVENQSAVPEGHGELPAFRWCGSFSIPFRINWGDRT